MLRGEKVTAEKGKSGCGSGQQRRKAGRRRCEGKIGHGDQCISDHKNHYNAAKTRGG